MSFFIDIQWYWDTKTQTIDCCETDYTIQDCVDEGWLDPATGMWKREFIYSIEYDPEWPDMLPLYGPLARDPMFGRNILSGLTMVQKDGQWLADVGNGILFK